MMNEADDINGMENNDNPGTRGSSLGMVPPGVDGVDNDQDAPEISGAIGDEEPEQLTRAQQATENELRRLGSRNLAGRREELEFPQDRRRRESNLMVSKTQHEILCQKFGEQLEDLEENQALGRWTEEQLRRAFRELRMNEGLLHKATEELTGRQARVGAVE